MSPDPRSPAELHGPALAPLPWLCFKGSGRPEPGWARGGRVCESRARGPGAPGPGRLPSPKVAAWASRARPRASRERAGHAPRSSLSFAPPQPPPRAGVSGTRRRRHRAAGPARRYATGPIGPGRRAAIEPRARPMGVGVGAGRARVGGRGGAGEPERGGGAPRGSEPRQSRGGGEGVPGAAGGAVLPRAPSPRPVHSAAGGGDAGARGGGPAGWSGSAGAAGDGRPAAKRPGRPRPKRAAELQVPRGPYGWATGLAVGDDAPLRHSTSRPCDQNECQPEATQTSCVIPLYRDKDVQTRQTQRIQIPQPTQRDPHATLRLVKPIAGTRSQRQGEGRTAPRRSPVLVATRVGEVTLVLPPEDLGREDQ